MPMLISISGDIYSIGYWIVLFSILIEVAVSVGLFFPSLRWILFLGALGASILAGVGILNIWLVILIVCGGVLLGDSINYFLGKKYGFILYQYLEKKVFLKKYIHKMNYSTSLEFFKKYGNYSIFFAKFLKSMSWTVTFLAGSHKLKYKTFLRYDLLAVVISLGRFIVTGYFIGFYYKIISDFLFKYSFIILFLILILVYLYFYLKKKRYIDKLKIKKGISRKNLFIFIIKHFITISIVIVLLFITFLSYLSFDYNGNNKFSTTLNKKTILLNDAYLNNCKNLETYYADSHTNIIQSINIILVVDKDKNISNILKNDWIKIPIFRKNMFTLNDFITSIKNEKLPVSDLYLDNISQDVAYQYKKSSFIQREHIRFWKFINKNNPNQNIYLGSISNDNGLTFQFYNHFFMPVHGISRDIDKSRDFFYQYLNTQKNITCYNIQTKCHIKKAQKNLDEQQYYTDGKILFCKIK